jgi:dephospho-CoA kinase
MTSSIPKFIALAGLPGAGKDVLANELIKRHGYKHLKIASFLKDTVSRLFGLSDEQVHGSQKDAVDSRWKCTPRQILQFFGTDMMQLQIQQLIPHIGRRFWVDSVLKDQKYDQPIVISDLRFLHEYEALTDVLGRDNVFIIRIERDGFKVDSSSHVAEREHLHIPTDLILINHGNTPEELYDDLMNSVG